MEPPRAFSTLQQAGLGEGDAWAAASAERRDRCARDHGADGQCARGTEILRFAASRARPMLQSVAIDEPTERPDKTN
jgi:hypothetical protein